MTRQEQYEGESRRLRRQMVAASDCVTDERQASTIMALYPLWAKGDWRDYRLGTIRRHGDRLWKFCQPALSDESQNAEPGTVGSEALWAEIQYRDGVRIIPDAFLPSQRFEPGELGWWHGSDKAGEGVYENILSIPSTWTPEEYPAGWELKR